MKRRNINKAARKELLRELSAEANGILSRNNARSSLIIAYVFTVSMAGAGLIVSYLLLNTIDYFGAKISDAAGYFTMFGFVYLFGAPAFSSVRRTARAICEGREVSLPEIFAVFSSIKSFGMSYLPVVCLSWIPRHSRGKVWLSDFFDALRTRMLYASPLTHILNFLLSFATCFIYFIINAGPYAAIRRELILRRIGNINLKNNERKVKRND